MNLQLAQKHYHSRFLELRELIMAEELKFKLVQWFYNLYSYNGVPSRTILREIEEIKVGFRGETLNQRQEEEEETHREVEGKEEEEAGNDGDDVKVEEEEEENKEEEGQQMSEEIENQEGVESNVIVEEGEEGESKEEETEEGEASEGENDRKEEEEEENKEGEGQEMIKPSEEMEIQEEMESNVVVEEGKEGEESKEEETEINPVAVDNSQERHSSPLGQDKTDVDHEQDDLINLGNDAELDMGSESENAATPVEIPASPSSLNLAEAVDEEHTSGDELVMFRRRVYYVFFFSLWMFTLDLGSSRRRKSSATSLPPPPTRKRLRSQGRVSELEPQLTVDSENDSEIRDDYPQVDDDQISSPFDGSMAQRRDGMIIVVCLISS